MWKFQSKPTDVLKLFFTKSGHKAQKLQNTFLKFWIQNSFSKLDPNIHLIFPNYTNSAELYPKAELYPN